MRRPINCEAARPEIIPFSEQTDSTGPEDWADWLYRTLEQVIEQIVQLTGCQTDILVGGAIINKKGILDNHFTTGKHHPPAVIASLCFKGFFGLQDLVARAVCQFRRIIQIQ